MVDAALDLVKMYKVWIVVLLGFITTVWLFHRDVEKTFDDRERMIKALNDRADKTDKMIKKEFIELLNINIKEREKQYKQLMEAMKNSNRENQGMTDSVIIELKKLERICGGKGIGANLLPSGSERHIACGGERVFLQEPHCQAGKWKQASN